MTPLSDFERYVLPFVADAPRPAVQDAILDACVEFCTRTRILRTNPVTVALDGDRDEYQLDAPTDSTTVVDVVGVWLPEGQISPLTRPDLDAMYPAGWAGLKVSTTALVRGFYCRLPGLIRLIPSVSAPTFNLTVMVSYAPKRSASSVDDVLFERFAEVIAAGALGRLHQHPGTAYADPLRVAGYLQLFESAIIRFADEAQRCFAYRPLRTGQDEFA
ncbi:hypothetical protein ACMHYO_16225 [Allopusillimonas ginsengisoli]|uniref:hypothetical protein n=1 Tax=Allopusillimonas ginsengisoli TaxID=453575 RepID=UPI0039C27305